MAWLVTTRCVFLTCELHMNSFFGGGQGVHIVFGVGVLVSLLACDFNLCSYLAPHTVQFQPKSHLHFPFFTCAGPGLWSKVRWTRMALTLCSSKRLCDLHPVVMFLIVFLWGIPPQKQPLLHLAVHPMHTKTRWCAGNSMLVTTALVSCVTNCCVKSVVCLTDVCLLPRLFSSQACAGPGDFGTRFLT